MIKPIMIIASIALLAAGCNNPVTDNQSYPEISNVNLNLNSNTPANNFVPNEILVVFKPGTSPTKMQEIAKAAGGTIEPYTEGKTAYKITLTQQSQNEVGIQSAIDRIKNIPEVSSAEPNMIITIPDCSQVPC